MSPPPLPSAIWLTGITQLLEEHHLVVLSDDSVRRADFGRALCRHLEELSFTQVIRIDGGQTTDFDAFNRAILPSLRRTPGPVADMPGLIDHLRERPGGIRQRYIVWSDAGEMLERDVPLFGRLVNAIMAVAVEHEHLSDELLLVQRLVVTGASKLGAYAEEEQGQLHRWMTRADGLDSEEIARCVSHPPVLTLRLDG